eukprot:TRINITY_DN50458_c0_g1_i1.p1 TRINITY_DN50458_c0_g1~~TRINITY_DN50458_c0_g1_i1.p1  ORF type:complete len:651 (-),score=119.39 TRINITY_DN50458_c0_g1_i1:68-2020(-)
MTPVPWVRDSYGYQGVQDQHQLVQDDLKDADEVALSQNCEELLCDLRTASDWASRAKAARILGDLAQSAMAETTFRRHALAVAIPSLVASLHDVQDVGVKAAHALGYLAVASPDAVLALLWALRNSESIWVRIASAEALKSSGKSVVPHARSIIAAALQSGAGTAKSQANGGAPGYIYGYDQDILMLRWALIKALLSLDQDAEPHVMKLVLHLQDADKLVRTSAAEALSLVAKAQPLVCLTYIDKLAAALQDDQDSVRIPAAQALCHLGGHATKHHGEIGKNMSKLSPGGMRLGELQSTLDKVTTGHLDWDVTQSIFALQRSVDSLASTSKPNYHYESVNSVRRLHPAMPHAFERASQKKLVLDFQFDALDNPDQSPVLVCWYSGGFSQEQGRELLAALLEAAADVGLETLVLHFPDSYGIQGQGSEPWPAYVDRLIEEIDRAPERRGRPLFLFGHSRGCTPAMSVAKRLGQRVLKVYCAACAAPKPGEESHFKAMAEHFQKGSEIDMLRWLYSIQPDNEMLQVLVSEAESEGMESIRGPFVDSMLDIVKRQYRDAVWPDMQRDFSIIPAPIMAISPTRDATVQPNLMTGWKLWTSAHFSFREVDAGHMECLQPVNMKKGHPSYCELINCVCGDMYTITQAFQDVSLCAR